MFRLTMYGQRIKELRTEKNMTQGELAQLLHVNQVTVSKYEREIIDLGTQVVINLSRIFKVTTDYILGVEDETGSKPYR